MRHGIPDPRPPRGRSEARPPPARAPVPEARPRDEDEDIPFDPFGDLGEDGGGDLGDEGEDCGAAIGPRIRSRPKRSGGASGFLRYFTHLDRIAGVVGLFLLFLVVSFIAFRNSRGGSPAERMKAARDAAMAKSVAPIPDQFPELPPVPKGLVPSTKNPPMGNISVGENAMRRVVEVLNEAADQFATIHDRQSALAAGLVLGSLESQLKVAATHFVNLSHIQSPPAAAEVAKRVMEPYQAAIERLQSEFRRICATEVGSERADKLAAGFKPYMGLLQTLQESAAKYPDEPYIEAFVSNVPDEFASRAFDEVLKNKVERQPSQSQAAWNEATRCSSYRL